MKSIKQFFFIALIGLLFVCQSSFALPFSVIPLGTLPTTVDNVSEATAYYTVTNTTTQAAPASFVKFLPQNVKQVVDKTKPEFCGAVFNLAPNAHCILALNVSGPVNPRDPNPEHHLFVCRAGGKTCAGTPFELNVTQITLVSIAVTPPMATIPKGTTQQYAATGTFSDGSTKSLLTYNVSWQSQSTPPGVASINASTGLATGVNTGAAQITATLAGITSPPATLNVSAAVLTSISITPFTASIPNGTTLQYTAIGTYSDGSTADITKCASGCVTWHSDTSSVAMITSGASGGLATGVTVGGPVTITATLSSITSNSATLNVTAAVLQCITVTPDPGNVAASGACAPGMAGANCLAFTAMGTYSDGSPPVDITTSVTWASSNPSNASISNAGGPCPGSTCKGTALGLIDSTTTNITATLNGITSQNAVLNISSVLLSIAVTPPYVTPPPPTSVNPFVIYVGESFPYKATGTFNNGPPADITNSVAWGTSDPAKASVQNIFNPGLVTGMAPGAVRIIAASGPVSGFANLMVNNQQLFAGLANTSPNVCMSPDGGSSWINCTTAGSQNIIDMASVEGSIYAVTSGSACYSPNNNLNWTCVALANPTIPEAIAAFNSYVYVSGFNADPCVSVSSNNGATYGSCILVESNSLDSIASLAVMNLTNLYAGMQSGSVCRSTNNGVNWVPTCVPTGLNSVASLAVDKSTGYVYAGGNLPVSFAGAVCYSTTAGNSFNICSDPVNGLVTSLAVANGYLYAGTNAGTVCVSTDNGSTFNCPSVPGGGTIAQLVIDQYGLVFAASSSGQVCQSYDHAATWPICHTVNGGFPVNGLAITQP